MSTPIRDLRLLQFNLRIAVLEPYADVELEMQGAERGVHFRPLEAEVLAAVERVVEARAGSMKGLVQVEVRDVRTKIAGPLIEN
jgi:hypothetical protein